MIRLREVLESQRFHESKSKLTLALGKTIDGANYVADLAKMPHLLIAGATGAGKSVALNTILTSMLYKATPDEVKFICSTRSGSNSGCTPTSPTCSRRSSPTRSAPATR